MRLLKISPSSTHVTGPQLTPKNTTYRLAATTATTPAAGPSCGTALPATIATGAVPKIQAMVPSVNAMPSEPVISSGLRPTRSTSAIATKVTRMLVTDVTTVIASALSCVKPTACQSVAE